MEDKQISDLTALTAPADGDLIPIVDISDTTDASSGTTKKIAVSSFFPSSSTDNAIARFQRDKIVLEYHRTTQAWKAFREEMVPDLEGDTFIAVTLKELGSSTATMEMAEYAKRIRRDAEIRLKEIGQQ
jgi:hypothetical protein